MKKMKISQNNDFYNVDVRRLEGLFEDYLNVSTDALKEMRKWLENNENDISFEEAKKRLSYYLARVGISD